MVGINIFFFFQTLLFADSFQDVKNRYFKSTEEDKLLFGTYNQKLDKSESDIQQVISKHNSDKMENKQRLNEAVVKVMEDICVQLQTYYIIFWFLNNHYITYDCNY